LSVSPRVVHPMHPLRLICILCLRWPGTLMFLVGWLVLGRDIFTWFTHGGRVDLAVARLSDILPALLNFIVPTRWDGLPQGILEFSRVLPLSLVLLALGWCSRQLAQAWLETAWDSAQPDGVRNFGSAD